ncbi:GNAT family N-acetyltransferase [Asanoa siamensis]|uniref:N-acetyltransferase domain-containing protein n=1 Tax=Asanoa siamensis TaxID=926357 RepID=A0ABQ4CYP4_9ACTN|nr:GNAT family N-acetyltransferase [Asanoa siamensis]GIF75967.1 hypothetical protein Asi02nite_54850 [Asanoa siamensis]
MDAIRWRAAAAGDAAALANLFASSEAVAAVELETSAERIRSRLAHPGLDLDRYTTIGLGPDGSAAAYAEVCDMGVAADALRLRLTRAIRPDIGDEVDSHLHSWLLEKAGRLHRERAPELDAILGTRCGDSQQTLSSRLTDAGFEPTWRKVDMVHDLNTPRPTDAPTPPELVIVPFETRYDERTWRAHNDAYAASPSAAVLDRESWQQHATGLSSFLPGASFVAVTPEDDVAAFVLTVRDTDDDRRNDAVLECVGTRVAWRRRGLARTLVAEALRACRTNGFERVRLQADSANSAAIELYVKLGFIETGRGYSVLTRRLKASGNT